MKLAAAVLLLGALVTPTAPADRVTVFVELAETPAVDTRSVEQARGAKARTAAKARKVADVARAPEVARTSNAVPGVVLHADSSRLRDLARMPEVKAVHRTVPKSVSNASSAQLTRAVQVWRDAGRLGDGMRVGIVDTGIDYHHSDFGGPGAFPTVKVVGGKDFAGDEYDSNNPDSLPEPDADPMDCDGHGTHVAGTAAGFGVNADGSTFRGDYRSVDVNAMKIGPGTAPKALLYALKVFGCEGSTNLTGQALDWALDPNGDGDFADHLDVVNLSLGSDFGSQDDPDSLFVRKLTEHGVLVVASAGNGGDFYDVGGSPANTPEALAIANTRDAFAMLDGAEVNGAQRPGQYSLAFTGSFDLERPVVKSTVDGCKPLTEAVTGKFVWLEWDDNDATRACGSAARANNAADAGAAGVLLSSTRDSFLAGIAGNAKIPMFQFTGTVTAALRPSLDAGTLQVRMKDSLRGVVPTTMPRLADTITPSSSRGSRGAAAAKPDVAAPGDTILSAATGTGSGALSMGGTSMSSPHVAGIAALVREAHPDWTPEEIKASIMNTAGGDVTSGDDHTTGTREAPMRVGSGRVDAKSALDNQVLAMVEGDRGAVGVSFGPIEVGGPVVLSKPVRVVNKGDRPVRLWASYEPITAVRGLTYQLTVPYLEVRPGETARTRVMVHVTGLLQKSADPTLDLSGGRQFLAEASGLIKFSTDAGTTLRVPVYSAPKPVSDLRVTAGRVAGRGLDQGGYRARMNVLQLHGTSDRLPDCTGEVQVDCAVNRTARGGDLRYAGATATDSLLAFGVVTWDNWENVGGNTWPQVRFEAHGKKFVTRAVKQTDRNDRVTADIWVARTLSEDGEVVDEQPLNGYDGEVDTNLFDSNVVVLPVAWEAIGGTGPVTYTVSMASTYTAPADKDGFIDEIAAPMTFSPGAPAGELSTVVKPGDLVPGQGARLVLLHHNASGHRAQVI